MGTITYSRGLTNTRYRLEYFVKDILRLALLLVLIVNLAVRVTMPYERHKMMKHAEEFCGAHVKANYLTGDFDINESGSSPNYKHAMVEYEDNWWRTLNKANPGRIFTSPAFNGEVSC
jgi:hypothetical protein